MSANSIPTSWIVCQLGDVVNYGQTVKVEPHDIPDTSWVLELEDIEKDTSKIIQRISFNQRKSKSTKNYFQPGDVLYGKLRPYLNKILVSDSEGYCSTEIVPIQATFAINSCYLFYWMKSPAFLDYVSAVSHGLNMPRLGTVAGRCAPLILPPLSEQKRIADKLDAVLARVDTCRERLDRVPGVLERFRQSVINQAIFGELTRDWRQNSARHGNSQCDFQCSIDSAVLLPKIPDSWVWKKNSALASNCDQAITAGPFGTIFKAKDFRYKGVPIIFLRHIGAFRFINNKPCFMDKDIWNEYHKQYSVYGGEVLVAKLGDPPGVSCIYPENAGISMVTPDVIKMTVNTDVVVNKYVTFYFNSPFCKEIISALAFGATRLRIDMSMFKSLPVPLPPLAEQHEIVRRVEALFAHADALEAKYRTAREQLDRLVPALLAKAFRGELVPQDPSDEPAAMLLERIRAARAGQPEATRARRTMTQRRGPAPAPDQPEATMSVSADVVIAEVPPALGVSAAIPPSAPTIPLGTRTLADLRKAAGLNQAAVAKAMCLNQAYISQMETGKRAITEDQRRKLAEILGVSLEDMPY